MRYLWVYKLYRELVVPQPLLTIFDFFRRPENLETITPPWLRFRIQTPLPIEMKEGTRVVYQLRIRGFRVQWLTEIEGWNPPFGFVDIQVKGPYHFWRHTHQFSAVEGGTRIADTLEYSLPFGPLGRSVHYFAVRRDVERIFDYRSRRIQTLFGSAQGVKVS